MKADLTRDTFHPLKHFARVLTQQGRVQLDADMNEQAAILLRYLQTLAADLIGPAGGPANHLGFAIAPLSGAPNPLDFQIGFGNYYVNGVLCQADFVPITIFSSSGGTFEVINWSTDFDMKTIPYYEVFDATPGSMRVPVPVQISNPQRAQNQINIQALPAGTAFPNFANPKIRRLITYLNQPDFVYSTAANPASPLPLPANATIQVYLDVWERAITYAEDDSIREVALGGPDTAARSKVVWQVKWEPATTNSDGNAQCSAPTPLSSRGWLQAMAKQNSVSTDPCIINPNAAYTGPENQLYRVEINRAGTAGTTPGSSATFKWSRENGSVIFPIVSGGGTATVVLESLGRDDRFGLEVGSLVEVQDDRSVLSNLSGRLFPVQSINSTTTTVVLNGTPDSLLGSDETLHPLLRRWDQTSGDPAEEGLTLDTANDNCAFVQEGVWLMLEDGVQIRFQPADPVQTAAEGQTTVVNQYLTGDYWLIPARTATSNVEWPNETDAQGNTTPLALPPHGITHYYAPLAIVQIASNAIVASQIDDCRDSFGTLAMPVPPTNNG
jgi:hypothetical protein